MVGTRWGVQQPTPLRPHGVERRPPPRGPAKRRTGHSDGTFSPQERLLGNESQQEDPAAFVGQLGQLQSALGEAPPGGLRNFNDTRAKRCKTESRDFLKTALTVDIIPSDSVRLNDINKQVSFKNETAFKLAARSNSIEVNRCCRESDGAASPPPFSYDNYCLDQFNNSLSERVMIWLDLATQNRKHFDNVDLKKRIVTAHACPISQREKAGVRNLKTKRSVMERHQSCEQSKTKELVFDDKEQEAPLVTSQMECDPPEQVNEERTVKMRSNTAKRQLHIFLPNLPKKSSESGSFLSSKASSLFQANKL
jgi:hypothetical protein